MYIDPPSALPLGVSTEVTYTQSSRAQTEFGELVAVRPDGLLLLTNSGTLWLVPFGILVEARLANGADALRADSSEQDRLTASYSSRYPLGLTTETLDRLLAALGQPELVDLSH